MPRVVIAKLTHTFSVLLLVSFGVTFLLDLTPGDPAYLILGDQSTPQQVAEVHHALHLNDPLYLRYWHWLTDLVRGNFGESYLNHQSVLHLVLRALPVTAELIAVAFLLALAIALPSGIYSAYRAGGWFDRAWTFICSGLISLPPFVTSLLLVLIVTLKLHGLGLHLPATGWAGPTAGLPTNLKYLVLPATALALLLVPVYSRMLRADMVVTLQEDYILAARARGVPPRRLVLVHALRQSSFSLITLAGLSLGQLISGAAIVEVLFAIPGLGQLLVTSITGKDIPVVQGEVMFIALAYVALNTAVDLTYTYLDPRVRLAGAA